MSANLTYPQFFERLRQIKSEKGLTFADLAQQLGRDELFIAAIFYGQAKPEPEDVENLNKVLGIDYVGEYLGEHYFPDRGHLDPVPPQDPILYRLFEAVMVYGRPIRSLIHEKFGDGIMSAIDFRGHVEKVEDPKGDRVKITLDGKFLPYRRW
ncbi:cyanase [Malassezia brasiliensis]|uniref:Cyanate hydratase n=1 Tax=Malassezia brasiliensis TaxID=1821822 RepID=A0AAF0DYU9_9BASI|nr:cyanase [Malassezia brasiliensis]